MAWTVPFTWTFQYVPTAAKLNEQLRDNMTFLRAALDGSSNPIFPTQRVFTTSTGLVVGDMVIFCNSASAITASLPAASACPVGKVIVVKNINTGLATVNVAGAACNIDGAASVTLPVQWMSLTFFGDGANWYII